MPDRHPAVGHQHNVPHDAPAGRVVEHERLSCCAHLHLAAEVAHRRQDLDVMCASDDRAHESQTRRAAHITNNVMQLQVHECHGEGHGTN